MRCHDSIGSLFPFKWTKSGFRNTQDLEFIVEESQESISMLCNFEDNEIKNYALHYICGYVVRAILKIIDCSSCAKLLIASRQKHSYHQYITLIYSHFSDKVNRGDLIIPSQSAVDIVLCIEKEILIQKS